MKLIKMPLIHSWLLFISLIIPSWHSLAIPPLPDIITPKNTEFAIDLHSVIATRDHFKTVLLTVKLLQKFDFLRLLYNPLFIIAVVRLLENHGAAELVLFKLEQQFPAFEPFKMDIIHIFNAQRTITKTVDILKQLKTNGYHLFLFSNIGVEIFNDFTKQDPPLWELFDAYHIVRQQDNNIRKPDPAMYTLFNERYNPEHKSVIFIDDLTENIKTGNETGFYSILFTSPDQLERDLKALAIL